MTNLPNTVDAPRKTSHAGAVGNPPLQIRLAPERRAVWAAAASERGLSLSAWVRSCCESAVDGRAAALAGEAERAAVRRAIRALEAVVGREDGVAGRRRR